MLVVHLRVYVQGAFERYAHFREFGLSGKLDSVAELAGRQRLERTEVIDRISRRRVESLFVMGLRDDDEIPVGVVAPERRARLEDHAEFVTEQHQTLIQTRINAFFGSAVGTQFEDVVRRSVISHPGSVRTDRQSFPAVHHDVNMLGIFIVEIAVGNCLAGFGMGLIDNVARLIEQEAVVICDREVDVSGALLGESGWKAVTAEPNGVDANHKLFAQSSARVHGGGIDSRGLTEQRLAAFRKGQRDPVFIAARLIGVGIR